MRLRRAALGAVLALSALTVAGCVPGRGAAPSAGASAGSSAPASGVPTAGVPAASPSAASPSAAAAPSPAAGTAPAAGAFDSSRYSTTDPMSLWVVVDKRRPMDPPDFEAPDLVMPAGIPNVNGQPVRQPAADAVQQMHAAAQADGVGLIIQSAYRSYATQVRVYNNYVAGYGQAQADTFSARPGYSEHQTGLVIDFDDGSGCALDQCFANTPGGQWLAQHAWEYGWILRYPEDDQAVTGYVWEPWHYRYVGPELAAEMHRTGTLTLEEFFGLGPAPDYAS